ncbi:MAG: ferritin family protein [Candidatus Thermoplasmatota archaeon]|nr:ferritin family protein [Candidatus Thermoplasmatota archaeon]
MTDVEDILAAAIEFERFGKEYYMRFHELVKDAKAKALMKGLANDEEEHAELLTKHLESLGGAVTRPSREAVEDGLENIFPHRILKDSIETRDAISAIKLGIETEQRSIDFYARRAGSSSGELKEVFGKLEKMEREHLQLLQENLEHLQDDGVWYGYVPILEG